MAEMNILQGGIQKKMGAFYGYRRKGENILCASPFSHAPHNVSQKKSWSAFTKAQKLYGSLSRLFSEYLPLNYRNKNKINVIATYLKELIQEKQYRPQVITEIFDSEQTLELLKNSYYPSLLTIQLDIKNTLSSTEEKKDKIYIGIFSGENDLIFEQVKECRNGVLQITANIEEPTDYFVIILKSIWNGKKWQPVKAIYDEMTGDVTNRLWQLSKLAKYADVYIENGILTINSENLTIDNGILTINYGE